MQPTALLVGCAHMFRNFFCKATDLRLSTPRGQCYQVTVTRQLTPTKNIWRSIRTHPIHGPFHPRRPDTIISKMVRGMIPKRKSDGIEAFKRLRVYMGVPEAMKGASMKSFDDSKITKPESYYISIAEVAKQIGWKGE